MSDRTKTAKHVLQRGTHDGFDAQGKRKLYSAGDVVELTESQAKAFADKFTPLSVHEAEQKAVKAAVAAAAAAEEDKKAAEPSEPSKEAKPGPTPSTPKAPAGK